MPESQSSSQRSAPSNEYSNAQANTEANAEEVVISIPSDAGYIRVVRLAVMGIASRLALSFEDIEDLKLAVSEACNNAVLHARPNPTLTSGKKTPITIRLRTFGDRLEISVEDDGFVASPDSISPKHVAPTSPHDLPEGGMGLFLIETLMDKVEHETGDKTVVRMTKFLSPHVPHSHDETVAKIDIALSSSPFKPS